MHYLCKINFLDVFIKILHQPTMIQFFRRIRQKLITEGRMSKYLIYALGEIALVMIGILLALQVNNWNEKKKGENAKIEAIKDLRNEFISNRTNLKEYATLMASIRTSWEEYLSEVTEGVKTGETIAKFRPRSGTRIYSPSFSSLLSILNTGKIDKVNNEELKKALTEWEGIYGHFNGIMSRHSKFELDDLRNRERRFVKSPYLFSDHPDLLDFSFESRDDRKANIKRALEDKYYQVLLLSNYDLLRHKVMSIEPILQEMDRIIFLLDQELQ